MAPEIGQRYGPYEIQARLGGGGMGHVYRAWDARLHREVAIKLLNSEYGMPGMRERFLREARAASALNHPNICTVFDIGEQDGDPYLVMELLEGETLKDRIQRSTIQVDDLIAISKDVAEGLAAAHAKGIVHRDIKPANIFLVDKANGKVQAKVLDFGLAKIDGPMGARGRHLDLTSAGSTVGTLAYMSPEQARGEVLDLRSDLFSFGVVMYEMATRQTPFQGATSALVFVKLLNHPPDPVREWNDQISREMEKIILKLMAKERTARFQTAGELEQALVELDKPGGGGWLRKAIATVPLVRAPDPVVRERRTGIRKAAEVQPGDDRPVDRQAGDPPQMKVSSGSEAQLLRPVTRLPKEDSTGRVPPTPEARQVTPLPEGFVERRAPESRRMRYHPDHDEIFERPSRRATDVVRMAAAAETPAAPVAETPMAAESAARQNRIEAVAAEVADVSEKLRVDDGDIRRMAPVPGEEDDVFAGADVPQFHEVTVPPYRSKRRQSSMHWIGVGVLLAAFGVGVIFAVNRGHFGATLLTEKDEVVLTVIENRTADKMLDGSVAQGLHMALAQSPFLKLASTEAYLAARHKVGEDDGTNPNANGISAIRARAAAQRMGAKAYLYGSVLDGDVKDEKLRGTSAAYTLHLDLISVSGNDVLGSYEEHAVSLQQLPGAIDRLADEVRANVGEDSDSIGEKHNPLNREATGSMEAMHAFTLGEDALAEGRTMDALQQFQQAVTLDPRFVQAQLRLVVLYRKQKAEVAAEVAAKAALSAADSTSERTRTLAQYEYEMNASGDYVRATELIRRLVTDHPHDAEALADLARVLRLEGKLTDAVQTGEQATAEDPFNLDAYIQTSNALIGLDRYDAALQVELAAQRRGLPRVGGSLVGAYLEDRKDTLAKAVAEFETPRVGYRSDWVYGLYLDNSGRMSEGLALWRTNAAAAEKMKGLGSAAGYLLAQGAMDRALVSDCSNGLALAREAVEKPRGMMGQFNTGMAEALCGDATAAKRVIENLQRMYPQSTDVNGYMLADLKAAVALEANDPATALEELKSERQYDLISLTPYLRGRAHVAMRQVQIGIVDFQTVLSHQGIMFIVGSDVYPVAEIGVARAFADTGDTANSAGAYRQFLRLWKDADAGLPLMVEARSKTR